MRNPVMAALLAGAFFSLNANATDLLQIYKDALANDAQYASARAALTAGQEKSVQGRAGLLPGLSLSGSDTKSRTETQLDAVSGERTLNGYNNTWTLALSQPLFRWANWQQYEQGKLSVLASEAQFAQAKQDLIVRVGQAYFDVLAAQDTLATLQAQKIATSEQLASANVILKSALPPLPTHTKPRLVTI